MGNRLADKKAARRHYKAQLKLVNWLVAFAPRDLGFDEWLGLHPEAMCTWYGPLWEQVTWCLWAKNPWPVARCQR